MNILITDKVGKGRASHYHIVYLRDNDGVTSTDNKHSHPIVFEPGKPAQYDQAGAVLAEATESSWRVIETDHTHILLEYPLTFQKKQEDDLDLINRTIDLYKQTKKNEAISTAMAIESEEMYQHKQWKKADKDKLEAEDRAALTINKTEEKLDNLSGYQRQNRTDFKYLPTEEGDQRVADILNIVVKNITEQCYYPREETKVFDDSAITGRGIFNLYDDYDIDIQGKIIVERFPWDDIHYGPHEKEDLSDCDYSVKEKWFPASKLKGLYPDKLDRLTPEAKELSVQTKTKSEDWDTSHGVSYNINDPDLVDKTKKQYKLLELWIKEYRRVYILVNADDGFTLNLDGWIEKDVNKVKSIPGFTIIPRLVFDMRITKVISQVLLEDYYPDLAINDFYTVPVYAKKRKNLFWGKVEGVKDIQKLINKTYSQFIDILNKMAAYGWFYDDETFPNRAEEAKFKKNSSSPGFMQKLRSTKRPPDKVEGVKFPSEITAAITMLSSDMREIMNVNLEQLGMGGQSQSGIAIRQKIVQQLLGNDFLFDNLSFAKQKIGKIIVAMIQKMYTPERILRLVVNQNIKEPQPIGGRQLEGTPQPPQQQSQQMMPMGQQRQGQVPGMPQGTPGMMPGQMPGGQGMPQQQPEKQITYQEVLQLLANADLSKYDVVITESPASPSAMLSNFMFLLEIAGRGVPIPPTALFQFAPIPNKEKIIAEIQQQSAMDFQREKMKYDTEIQKSMIAQQGKGNMPGRGI